MSVRVVITVRSVQPAVAGGCGDFTRVDGNASGQEPTRYCWWF